jgi:predicted O-methyltransferase YrrM
MQTDPFAVKSYPRWHPRRVAHKSRAVRDEWKARIYFDEYALREMLWPDLPALPAIDWDETSVTPPQMGHLLRALAMTEALADTVIVEVGSFRGETTRCLAGATRRKVVAVDPYQGYGGAAEDLARFQARAEGLDNVVHERTTSGDAARQWPHGPASLVFIDAVHDYQNTSFDIDAWLPKLVPGGILALHDVDQKIFAGTRRAAYELLDRLDLVAHPDNLALFAVR